MNRMCFNCMKMTEDGEFCAFCGKTLKTAPAHHLLPGTVLNGKYTVGYALGEGGFGITYVGLDNSLEIKVAIKEFFPKGIVGRNSDVSSDVFCLNVGESEKMFDTEKAKVINEARILAKFSKERGIVNVREYFEANNTAYIVMEYLEGETLEEYLEHSGSISADEAYELLQPVMKVLDQLHNEKVVHRDISPDNLMFDGDQLKLLDFGAAREVLYTTSKSFSVILKHGYAPEEQYRRKGRQGSWTDVYALCATIYYCITKVVPDTSLDRLHVDELRRPTELGARITPVQETALLRGLSVLPEDRLQNVSEFIATWSGQEVPYANQNKDTVRVKNELTDHQTTGDDTVYGGSPGYEAVTSDGRNVTGYGVAPEMASNGKKKKKSKRTVVILSVVAVLTVLITAVGIIISGSLGEKPTDVSVNSEQVNPSSISVYSEQVDATKNTTDNKINEIIERAETMANEGKYDEASNLLDSAEKEYGKSAKITNLRKDIEKKQILSNIDQYESNGDYEGGIKYINSEIGSLQTDSDIMKKQNDLIDKYRSKVFAEAEAAFNSSGYLSAIDVLNDSKMILPNDESITQKIDEYKSYAPVSIKKFKVTKSSRYDVDDSASDPRGEVAVDVIELGSYVEFYLAGEYSKFSATIDPTHSFSTSVYQGVQLIILADDVEVYKSPTITYKTDNLDVSVDIKKANYLAFKLIYVGGTKYSNNWSADPILISNPSVSK